MKSLDLSKFKKCSAGDSHTVFEHPDGHKIFISHKSLKPGQREGLDNLTEPDNSQYLASGGEVATAKETYADKLKGVKRGAEAGGVTVAQGWNNLVSEFGPSKAAPRGYASGGQIPDSLNPNLPTELPAAAAPMQPESHGATGSWGDASSASADNYDFGSQASFGASQTGQQSNNVPSTPSSAQPGTAMGIMDAGIRNEAAAQGAMGDESMSAGQLHELDADTAQNEYAKHMSHLDNQRQLLKEDLHASHIDPDHYIGSLSTGGKIATAIGLMLGGIGSGLTGKENPAARYLEQQIDRDMQAQKANLSKKEGLLHANMQETGDERSAASMTRMQLNDMYAHKIATIASKYQSPMAEARAQQMIGQLHAQNQALQAQTAQHMTVMSGLDQGSVSPEQAVQYLVPKEHQAKVFGEIEAAQNTARMGGEIMNSFETAAKENTIAKTGAGLLRTPGSVYSLHQSMQPTFKDLEGTVRQAAMENTFKNITPSPGDSEHTIQQKREALQGYLQSKASTPVAKGFGIDLQKLYRPKNTGFTPR